MKIYDIRGKSCAEVFKTFDAIANDLLNLRQVKVITDDDTVILPPTDNVVANPRDITAYYCNDTRYITLELDTENCNIIVIEGELL